MSLKDLAKNISINDLYKTSKSVTLTFRSCPAVKLMLNKISD